MFKSKDETYLKPSSFKSKDEAYLKHSSFKSKSYILRIGNGFFLILLLSTLKSEMKRSIPLFLGLINVGTVHSEIIKHLCLLIS